ncbi:hypothetical protein A9Q86_01485 [Flavobacteriales bacterium 33_180_T64]|nr:hypothetical protein A9Q86_01485 [Flavobacteriales bacterium 33_180_T64]
MKKYFLVIIVCQSFLFGCGNNYCKESNKYTIEVSVDKSCYFSDRNTVNQINGKEGVIKFIGNDTYLISTNEDLNYFACNLPDSIKINKLKIYFCGEEKEIKPTEHTLGAFLELTSVFLKDELIGDNDSDQVD